MLLAWRFSRTFASRFNFANVVFFLPAKVDLQVVQANRGRRAEHGFPAGERAASPGKASRVHTGPAFGAGETAWRGHRRFRNPRGPKTPTAPGMARPGLEPGTPRFSVVCSTN